MVLQIHRPAFLASLIVLLGMAVTAQVWLGVVSCTHSRCESLAA